MSWEHPAGIAKIILSKCRLQIAKPIIVKHCTSGGILLETLLTVIYASLQLIRKIPASIRVFINAVLINHNLPANAAALRTFISYALKLIVSRLFSIKHNNLLNLFSRRHYNTNCTCVIIDK